MDHSIKEFIGFLIGVKPEDSFWETQLPLFRSALTHGSHDGPEEDYERLEVLGDTVITLVVTENLYRMDLSVKEICNRRKEVISGQSLVWVSRKLGMDKHIFVDKGCEVTDSILEDVYEAFIGACYLSLGYARAREIVNNTLFRSYLSGELVFSRDYKTQLQEWIQGNWETKRITYVLENRERNDEGKELFTVLVKNNGSILGTGQGFRIKDAEQNAAKCALLKLDVLQSSEF